MIHVVTAETLSLLAGYCSDRELRRIALNIRRRKASRKIGTTRSAGRPPEPGERAPVSAADFGDAESVRVLDAIADALIGLLAIQQAREDHRTWLSTQKELS